MQHSLQHVPGMINYMHDMIIIITSLLSVVKLQPITKAEYNTMYRKDYYISLKVIICIMFHLSVLFDRVWSWHCRRNLRL